MKSRWTFRCYPTPEQAEHLNRTFGCARYVWNWALHARTEAFHRGDRKGYPATSNDLTLLKKTPTHAWLNDVSSVCLQQTLRDLQGAFSNFFDKRSAYPAFKRKAAKQSVNYTLGSFSLNIDTSTLRLAKIGAVKVVWSRPIPQCPSSIRLIRTASGKFFASMVVEIQPKPLPKTGETVGIDFGVVRLATLSNGERIANPKYGKKWQQHLAHYQQRLARCQKGSKRRLRVKRHIARIHEKIANCRVDALHKFSTKLVTRFDAIYVEDLNLRGMVKNHSLARSLNDASIGTAVRMLEYKAERYSKTVVKIDRWFPSSKTCSACGHVVETLPLSVRDWVCPKCTASHDRDLNAAINIKAVGQTVSAHGGTVRRAAATAVERRSRRSANQQNVNCA